MSDRLSTPHMYLYGDAVEDEDGPMRDWRVSVIRHLNRKRHHDVDCSVCDGVPRREWDQAKADILDDLADEDAAGDDRLQNPSDSGTETP